MPLKIKLGPGEKLAVNGAVLENGDRKTSILVHNYAHIMREKDILQEEDVQGPVGEVYYMTQMIILDQLNAEKHHAGLQDKFKLLRQAIGDNDEAHTYLNEVAKYINEGNFYKALMLLKPVLRPEEDSDNS